jgi:hypothetical protein
MEIRYTRHDGFVANDLGHELLLHDPQEREVLVLNLTARFVWMLCGAPHSVPEIAQALLESFDQLDFDTAVRDVEDLLQAHGRFFRAKSDVTRGAFYVSKELKNPDERLSGRAKASGRGPGYVKPAVRKIAEARFIEQFQGFPYSVDPSQFGDTWEGCDGDATR